MEAENTNIYVYYEPNYSTADEILEALDPRNEELGDDGWVFRGHADSKWRLVPSALRPNAWVRLSGLKEINMEDRDLRTQMLNEYSVVANFAEKADRQGLHVPGYDSLIQLRQQPKDQRFAELLHDGLGKGLIFPPVEWESLFAMAQHYGVPTRLLDWSESSYVAAYFAAIESAKAFHENPKLGRRRLSIWAINLTILSYIESSETWGETHTIKAPWATNPNLRAQKGLFTVHRHIYRKGPGAGLTLEQFVKLPIGADTRIYKIPPSLPLEKVVTGLCESASEPIRESYLVKPIMRCYSLPWKESPALLKKLDQLGISASLLFPGYLGATRHLEELRFLG